MLPTFICDVALVRAELERRHARSSTAILPFDYLDLAIDGSDIIDTIGENILGRTRNLSSTFRVCCVDMCWIGHGEALPRDVPANARQTLYIARVNQNHFVPLRRSRRRGGEVPLSYTPYFGKKGYIETNIAEVSQRKQENMTQITTATNI